MEDIDKLIEENEQNNIKSIQQNNNSNSVLFSNSFIQNSFNRMIVLKRLISKKIKLLLIFYFDKWNYKIKKPLDYLSKNREIINLYCDNEVEDDFINEPIPIKRNNYFTKNKNFIIDSILLKNVKALLINSLII